MARLINTGAGSPRTTKDEEAGDFDLVREKLRKYKRKPSWARRLWKCRLLVGVLFGAAVITVLYL